MVLPPDQLLETVTVVVVLVMKPPVPFGVKAPPLKGRCTSGKLTFRSFLQKPGSIPVPGPTCQASSPTTELGPNETCPFGPVKRAPNTLTLPNVKELVRLEFTAMSP